MFVLMGPMHSIVKYTKCTCSCMFCIIKFPVECSVVYLQVLSVFFNFSFLSNSSSFSRPGLGTALASLNVWKHFLFKYIWNIRWPFSNKATSLCALFHLGCKSIKKIHSYFKQGKFYKILCFFTQIFHSSTYRQIVYGTPYTCINNSTEGRLGHTILKWLLDRYQARI